MLPELECKKYRSGVGSLLYLVKHSRPYLANCVRELSKVMMKPGLEHYGLLLRAIKFVRYTKEKGILFKLTVWNKEPWRFETYVDK